MTAQQLCFVDGTFAEQAQEMADYLQVGDVVRPLLEKDQREEALQALVKASGALSAVPEKEFTPAYNLLIHLVLDSPEPKRYLPVVCQNLAKPVTSSPANSFALASNALSAIFNQLAFDNPLRFNVFMQIIRFARQQNQFDNLKPNLKHLDSWFKEWDTDEEEQHKLWVEVAEAAAEAGDREESYYYLLKALGCVDRDNQEKVSSEESQKLSLRALRMAITSQTRFDFNGLRALPTVQALADTQPVYSQLLDIFTEQDLEDYNEFRAEHEGWIEKEKLDHEVLQHKMRLLTFASLAASTPNRMIPYDGVAHALQVPAEDIEMWTIDAIRAGLVEGRLSQKKKVFLVHRTTYRVFGEKQWRELGTRIDQLRGVIDNVAANLRKGQMEAAQAREREIQEAEKKLAGAGLGDGGGRYGGDNRRRQQQRQRTDDDD